MFSMRVSSIIQAVRDQILPPRKGPPVYRDGASVYPGLAFSFDCGLCTGEISERIMINAIVCGNTSTFIYADDFVNCPSIDKIPYASWKNTSNHDSCWRSDGLDSPITKLYFEMANRINAQRVKLNKSEVAPIHMHDFSNSNILTRMFTRISVSIKPVERYGREIVDIKIIPEME